MCWCVTAACKVPHGRRMDAACLSAQEKTRTRASWRHLQAKKPADRGVDHLNASQAAHASMRSTKMPATRPCLRCKSPKSLNLVASCHRTGSARRIIIHVNQLLRLRLCLLQHHPPPRPMCALQPLKPTATINTGVIRS